MALKWVRGDLCSRAEGTLRIELTGGNILLVREHEQQAVLHLTILDDAMQFLSGLVDARSVGGVNDENEALSAWKDNKWLAAGLFGHLPRGLATQVVREGGVWWA